MTARCGRCHRFMSWTAGRVFTPYGNALDLEPPDEERICDVCWAAMGDEGRALVHRIAWVPVQKVTP